ncbi:ROK family protein [Schaalia suimastitidis]|uniref:ROK family protein n=1 Tax=Schaalia suimastitidis TaxID=121163 RepID=UPI000428449D|nr:ROK family protein [Schaalia suimastitidis]
MTSSLAIGIDIGGTTIKGRVVTNDGRTVHRAQPLPTPRSGAVDVALAAVHLAQHLVDAYPDAVAPVGVCAPGIIDEATGVGILSANLGWHNAPLRDMLSEHLGRPVAFGHDVRSGALAEALWGVVQPHCLYVAVGTGIASALVINGELAPARPWSGEIGQVLVTDPDDPSRRVELEQVASASAIARRAVTYGILPDGCGARDVQNLAQSDAPGSARARDIQDSAIDLLGSVIATTLHQVGAMPVVLGGGLSKGGIAITGRLAQAIAASCTIFPAPAVVAARLGSDSQALGAAALAFMQADIRLVATQADMS